MSQLLRQKDAGFTIIEISIVIAIAGFIFVIIFGAIPTVERAGRNNERKQDVAKVLQAVSRYELNNGANFPAPADITGRVKLSFFNPNADVTLTSFPDGIHARSIIKHDDLGTMEVANYQKCDPVTRGSTSLVADYRDIVALYATESRDGPAPQCVQL